MRSRLSKGLEILVESINALVLTYVLSSMAFSFQRNVVFILFFACDIWVLGRCWETLRRLTGSPWKAAAVFGVNFLVFCLISWRLGYIQGTLVSFF